MNDYTLRQNQPEKFDNTMLSNWAKCPRAFYWFMRGLDYKQIPAYFTWGRAFGAALNAWHKTQGKLPLIERLAEAELAAEEEWIKDSPIETKADTWDNLVQTLRLYIDNYGEEEPWTMLYGEGELGFTLPIPDTSITYAGAIDAPIEWKDYGVLGREDKTTGGYITDQYRNQWNHATQVKGYHWALRQVLGREPFGYYMNIISKAHRRETADRFDRLLIKISEWEVSQWLRDTILAVDDVRREWDRWIWPKTGARDPINCAGGAGRSRCLYSRLCQVDMEPWDMEESYNFDEEFVWRSVWAPWEREGKNE